MLARFWGWSLAEDVFHFSQQGAALRFVLNVAMVPSSSCNNSLLPLVQFAGGLDADLDVQIAFAMAVQHGHAFATDAHGSARLHCFGDFQSVFAFQGGNANLSSERSLAEGNRNDAMQVGTFALKEGMLFNVQNHIKIASRTAKGPGFAQAGEADASTVFHSCRDLGLDGPLPQNPALAFALGARISDNTAGTLAGGAGTSHAEESLLVAHLSPSGAGAAGDRGLAGSSARTAAIFTSFVAADGDLGLLAEYCLLELQGDVLAQIGTTLGTGASAPTAAKKIAKTEKVAKNLAEILKTVGSNPADPPIPLTPAWPKRS